MGVPAHDCRVVALRPALDRPQFLGWNRQISQGGVLLDAEDWDPTTKTLSLSFPAAVPTTKAPFTYSVAVHVPSGFALQAADSTGVSLSNWLVDDQGEIVRLHFVPDSSGELTLSLSFS